MPSEDAKTLRLVRGPEGETAPSGHDRLIRTLSTMTELTDADQQVIRSLPGRLRTLDAHEDVCVEGARCDSMAVIVDGFACRYKILSSGRRQILSFHIPGDSPDLASIYIEHMDHSVATLAPSTIMFVEPNAVRDLFIRVPHTASVFWRSMLIDASIFREWMTNIGQRNAYSRLAHLLCELMTRMKAVGLASDETCELPITQAELADATGISTVHVNRSLQTLRGNGLLRWQAGSLTVLDWERLKEAGEFEQDYLHLRERVA